MSLHPSFGKSSKTSANRNVLTRAERLAILKKNGRWKPGSNVTCLPKTRPVE